jgi:hypothetical protein
MGFEIDGKKLLEMMLLASITKDGDPTMTNVLKVFQKHGIGVMDAMAILLEISAAIESSKGEAEG